MKKMMNLIAGLALLTALGANGIGLYDGPIVRITNNTQGKVEFDVSVSGGDGTEGVNVKPGEYEEYDSNGLIINRVKIRYYPADGSPELSYEKKIPSGQDSAGWLWKFRVGNDSVSIESDAEAGDSILALIGLGGTDETDSTYYWPMELTNNSTYMAISNWSEEYGTDDFAVINPGETKTVKRGDIKLFEVKDGNPVKLTKEDLNKKTLEINGSDSKGFSLSGSGNSVDKSDSRTYKNNTKNWVTYDHKDGDWRILAGANAQADAKRSNGQKADVHVYTNEKKALYLEKSDHYSWIIDANGELEEAD